MTSPQPRGIIIPIVSENLPFKVKRKALPMPSGQNEGMGNFPYQILLVSFHLQYRNDLWLVVQLETFSPYLDVIGKSLLIFEIHSWTNIAT